MAKRKSKQQDLEKRRNLNKVKMNNYLRIVQ